MKRLFIYTCLTVCFFIPDWLFAQSAESYIQQLDAIYSRYQTDSSQDAIAIYKEEKARLYQEAPSDVLQAIDDTLIERLFVADESGNDETFLQAALSFLIEARWEHPAFPSVIVQLAQIYEDRNDISSVSYFLQYLKALQSQGGVDCPEEIALVEERLHQMIQNQPFSEDINGVWVSDFLFGKKEERQVNHHGIIIDGVYPNQKSRPFTVLNISPAEVRFDISRAGFATNPMQYQGMDIAQSIMIDNEQGIYQLGFANQKFKGGNYSQSAIWYDAAQDADARMMAVIKTDAKSLSDVFTGTLVDVVATSALEALAQSFATSRSKLDLMIISGQRIKPGVLSATLTYRIDKASNPSSTEVYKRTTGYYQSAPYRLYKLTPESGVVISNKKGYPWYTYMQSYQATSELEAIRERHGMSNPKYWIPLVAGMVAGSAMMYYGMKEMVNDSKSSDRGFNWGHWACFMSGLSVFTLSIAIPCSISTSKKHSAVREFNQRQLELLEEYYQ